MHLSLIIPCYNEIDNLSKIVSRISDVFVSKDKVTVILVDNGSTDGSFLEMKRITKDLSFIKLVKVHSNQGYGHGIMEGLNMAGQSDLIAWTHADMQTDPKDVLKALDIYKSQNRRDCLIKGKRVNRPALDAMLSFAMQVFASILLRTKVNEINAQPKLISNQFFKEHVKQNAPLDFSFDLYVLFQAKKKNLEIISFPVKFLKRIHGEAKGGGGSNIITKFKLIKRTLLYIISLRKNLR